MSNLEAGGQADQELTDREGGRLLIVDDNARFSETLATEFRDRGYTVETLDGTNGVVFSITAHGGDVTVRIEEGELDSGFESVDGLSSVQDGKTLGMLTNSIGETARIELTSTANDTQVIISRIQNQ